MSEQASTVFASIITIGDELLIGQTIDTNSAFIAQELNRIGVWVRRRVAVGDLKEDIRQASSGEEAIEITRIRKPDIILMDVNMSPVNGFDATKQIHKISPESKVIAVSMHSMPAYAKRMLQLGAMGYVTKNSSKEEMITAIVEVYNGKKYICEEVKNILAQQELDETSEQSDMNNLSRRELDIIKLIKEGLSSKEIAVQLDISLKTVEVHRYNILKKLKLKNTAALVNFINAKGL